MEKNKGAATNAAEHADCVPPTLKELGESLEVQNDIAEIKIRAERQAGEIL